MAGAGRSRAEVCPGQLLNRFPVVPGFAIEEEIGRGTSARVFRARQEKLNRTVALKVIPTLGEEGNRRALRLFREASLTGALDHPAIVRAIDAGDRDDFCWFAMELVEGRTLQQVLDEVGPVALAAGGRARPRGPRRARPRAPPRRRAPRSQAVEHPDRLGGPRAPARPRPRAPRDGSAAHARGRDGRHAALHGAGAGARPGQGRRPRRPVRARRGPLPHDQRDRSVRGRDRRGRPDAAPLRRAGAALDAPAGPARGRLARHRQGPREGPRAPVPRRARVRGGASRGRARPRPKSVGASQPRHVDPRRRRDRRRSSPPSCSSSSGRSREAPSTPPPERRRRRPSRAPAHVRDFVPPAHGRSSLRSSARASRSRRTIASPPPDLQRGPRGRAPAARAGPPAAAAQHRRRGPRRPARRAASDPRARRWRSSPDRLRADVAPDGEETIHPGLERSSRRSRAPRPRRSRTTSRRSRTTPPAISSASSRRFRRGPTPAVGASREQHRRGRATC